MLLVSVLDKIGTFGMIRFCLELFPEASRWATPVVVVLAIFSILYGAFMAIGSQNIPRLIAYSSVSHFGFIVLGIFVMNSQGLSGANLYMFNHGLSTAALFLVTGFLIKRRGSAEIDDFGGVEKVAPVLAGLFLVSGLSAVSLPGLSPFVSELLVMVGAFVHSPWAASFAVLGIVLVAIYVLWMYQRTMTGPVREGVIGMPDLNLREIVVAGSAAAAHRGARLLPEAAARRDQPLRRPHHGAGGQARSPAHRDRRGGPRMNSFEAPTIEYFTVSPILIVLGVAVLGVLVEAFVPRRRRYLVQVVLALVGIIAAIVTSVMIFLDLNPGSANPKSGEVVAMGALAVDGPALVLLAAGARALAAERAALRRAARSRAAYSPSPGRPRPSPAPRRSARPRPRASSTPRSSR